MVKAHFNDLNIVLGDHGWEKVPSDSYGTPPAIISDSWKSNNTNVVVLIASLRETRLVGTVESMFDNAANPKRIYAAIVQQNTVRDRDIIEEICDKRGTPVEVKADFKILLKDTNLEETNPYAHKTTKEIYSNPNNCFEFDHVRVLRLDTSEAKGPVFARGLQPTLVSEETDEFCMQIDAHTIFKKDWDWLMQQQYGATENEYAVLSTYPTNYKDLYKNANNHWEMPHLCGASISRGSVRNHQAKAAANLERPIIAPLWAAGLSFSKCHAELNVPNDVHLEHVFTGEEFARGARLWTNGYDFYTITRPIIGVYYGKDKGGKGGWKSSSKRAVESQNRMATLLKAPGSDQSLEAIAALGKFTAGNKRTLEQYYEFSGVDIINQRSNSKCVAKYVPWEITKEPISETNSNEKDILLEELYAENIKEHEVVSPTYTFTYLIAFLGILLFSFFIYKIVLTKKSPLPLWKRHLLRQRKQMKSMV